MSPEPRAYTRRVFLQRGATLASTAATIPWFVQNAAAGVMPTTSMVSSVPGIPDDRVMVIIQLGGGNDGLNTVVPYYADEYARLRPRIGFGGPGSKRPAGAALELDEATGLGLHPRLTGFKSLFDDGKLEIVQGVGYPNPNRSHFASMDIWHTGRSDGQGTGWLGRYFDNTCNGSPTPEAAISIGRRAPLALMGDVQKPVSFEDARLFRWKGEDLHDAMKAPYEKVVRAGALNGIDPDSQAAYLMRTSLDAQISSDRIRAAVRRSANAGYPRGPLADQLRLIAAMIRDGMPTRVYYATLGGFDTHGSQSGSHANLMGQLGDSVKAFQADLDAQGAADQVLTMVFSEFGRRVAENGSGGTDHGTAAPVFLIGDQVRPGVIGNHPSLTDLDGGDLRFGIDFRSVYAGLLTDWFKVDSASVLGTDHPPAHLLRS
ncbi:MAG: DUF1501 domain-containing protein [Phycisphaerales bacterium]